MESRAWSIREDSEQPGAAATGRLYYSGGGSVRYPRGASWHGPLPFRGVRAIRSAPPAPMYLGTLWYTVKNTYHPPYYVPRYLGTLWGGQGMRRYSIISHHTQGGRDMAAFADDRNSQKTVWTLLRQHYEGRFGRQRCVDCLQLIVDNCGQWEARRAVDAVERHIADPSTNRSGEPVGSFLPVWAQLIAQAESVDKESFRRQQARRAEKYRGESDVHAAEVLLTIDWRGALEKAGKQNAAFLSALKKDLHLNFTHPDLEVRRRDCAIHRLISLQRARLRKQDKEMSPAEAVTYGKELIQEMHQKAIANNDN